jgi:hypothetical protein
LKRLLILFALALLVVAAPAAAGVVPTPTLGGAHWAGGQPRNITIIDTLATTLRPARRAVWREYRDRAIEAWNVSDAINLTIAESPEDAYGYPTEDMMSALVPGVIRIARARTDCVYETVCLWQGVTLAPTDETQHTTGAVIYIRIERWYFTRYVSDRNHIRMLVGHEVGHALGLDHGGNGIMAGRTRPSEGDYAAIAALYGHID